MRGVYPRPYVSLSASTEVGEEFAGRDIQATLLGSPRVLITDH